MHPLTLATVNELLQLVLPTNVRVVMPFFFYTKGQLCSQVGPALSGLASVSMSCDEGEGHKPESMQHCGLCTSCIFRRIAIKAARQGPDSTSYRDTPTRRHGQYDIRSFAYQASELAKCKSFEDLVALDPNVQFAVAAPIEPKLSSDEIRSRVVNMYREYSREISNFLQSSMPVLRPREFHVKEQDRDLFSAAG
jgi:hypothetical protein